MTFGSETSGGVHDIDIQRLKVMKAVLNGILFKLASTRGGTTENIRISDVSTDGVPTPLTITMNWNPSYRGFRIFGISGFRI